MENVYDVLVQRGLIEQVSDEDGVRSALDNPPVTAYIGYDPTASSLHAGSLLTIMVLAHMQRHGHRPIALMGGGTGMIGDPSGRSELRQMLTPELIQSNVDAIKQQMSRFLDFGEGQALMLNNADWLLPLNYIEFLRDIGRHFSVNRMLAAESYKQRLERGLNFIEFNYQLLQAYDFLHLFEHQNCTMQFGGNDQWGNILAGVELIRRVNNGQAYAVTFPLLTTSSGAKMGKTAQGAVWLDAERLAPFDFYQYWINTEDADVERFLKIYTFLPMEEIAELAKLKDAEIRRAKEVLAFEITSVVHGRDEAERARDASRSLFGGEGASDDMPTTALPGADLESGIPLPDVLERVGLCKSRSEARRLIAQGGARVNDVQIMDADYQVSLDDMVGDGIILRAGKKRYHRVQKA